MTDASGVLLRGLDGANPLAFLAALGTLRTLTLALPGETVKMSWDEHEGAWRPRLWCTLAHDVDAIIEKAAEVLSKANDRASFAIGDNLNLAAEKFQSYLIKSVENVEVLT